MNTDFDSRALAAHVLRVLAKPRAKVLTIDDLSRRVDARREDVRRVISQLHREGHVDALRMRATMTGLAIATSMRSCKLREMRSSVSMMDYAPIAACA
jgi:transcription initiation factor IIE alpha subunit